MELMNFAPHLLGYVIGCYAFAWVWERATVSFRDFITNVDLSKVR